MEPLVVCQQKPERVEALPESKQGLIDHLRPNILSKLCSEGDRNIKCCHTPFCFPLTHPFRNCVWSAGCVPGAALFWALPTLL